MSPRRGRAAVAISGCPVGENEPVTGDREERNRVLGFPVDWHPNARPARKPEEPGTAQPEEPETAQPADQTAPQPNELRRPRPAGAEPQRVLGFPVDWLDEFADEVLRPLLRRLRGRRTD
jgi:hypothetical protein